MKDKIIIKDLECFAHHGVLKEENVLGQKFLVSLILYTDTKRAGDKDDLSLSINYAEVCQYITTFMKEHTFQLLETLAEKLAQNLLLTYPTLFKITVKIKKPWAPILLSLDTVAIEITRSWHEVYFGIGSNLGDKEKNILEALTFFREHPYCKDLKVSKLIKTEPYGYMEQDDFLNGAFYLKTLLTPEELLECISSVETNLKRERIIHWGPRTIDVDILFYDDLILHTEKLTIPHIEICKRDFVLRPLCDINPYLLHPVYKKTVTELLLNLQ